MSTPAPPGPLAWPRVYRRTRVVRVLTALGGLLFVVAALAFATFVLIDGPAILRVLIMPWCVPIAVFGVLACLSVHRDRLVLHEHSIELHQVPFRTRVVRREDIVGRRSLPPPHGLTLVLEVRTGEKPAKTTKEWASDAVLEAWLGSLRDLDAEDHARSLEALLASSALGPTVVERQLALRAAHRTGCLNIIAGLVATGWAFYPHPYSLLVSVLVLLPLIALATLATGRGLYWLGEGGNDARVSLAGALGWPGFVLALRTVVDHTVVDHLALFEVAVLGALTLGVATALVDKGASSRLRSAIVWTVLLLPYAWSTAAQVNVLLDRSEPETFRIEVLAARGASLELPPWGPHPKRRRHHVLALRDAVEPGDIVCAELHPGALGVRWTTIDECR